MNYYRKPINKVANDVKLKMQLGALTLKISENNNKIDSLLTVDKNIIKDVSTNATKIDTNENDISSNLVKINSIENDISTQIKSDIDEIKSNLSNIDFNSNKKYTIENFFIYNIGIENDYTLNKDNPEFSIFNYNLEDDFKSNSILEVNCKLLYDHTTYNNIGTLMHVFKLYDENNNLLHEYKNLKTNAGDNLKDDLNQIDLFYVKLNNNYSIIKIELVLSILDNITKSVSCKLYNSLRSNFLCIKHYKKINLISVNNNLGDLENTILSNSSKIDINKNDISTNLININTNEDNIAYNLSEINNIKNNNSKSYLKNIYNILFYDSKTQVDFRNLFYEKIFEVNAKENDFIEINLKMLLEYEDISEKNYVNTIYEIFDENNNSLYISIINNNDYQYFSNKIFVEENIFHFTKNVKNIKFKIKFVMTDVKVIKIWYINNDNYRLILKHYST